MYMYLTYAKADGLNQIYQKLSRLLSNVEMTGAAEAEAILWVQLV
jgi:hypothetical protein